MVVKDNHGWQMIVLKEVKDGVIVNWDYVEEGETRFIPHGEYTVVKQ